MFGWPNASLNVATRIDYADWNVGTYHAIKTNIGDRLWGITPALSFRPSDQTVFRFNYRYTMYKDVIDNSASATASWLFGFSTYF